MMGGSNDTMMGETSEDTMGGGTMGAETMITAEMFATMPVDTAFASVAQTCSACHQKFRAKEN
jgi:cytochrome c556